MKYTTEQLKNTAVLFGGRQDDAKTMKSVESYKDSIKAVVREHNDEPGHPLYRLWSQDRITIADITIDHITSIIPVSALRDQEYVKSVCRGFAQALTEFYGISSHDVYTDNLKKYNLSQEQLTILKKYYPASEILSDYMQNDLTVGEHRVIQVNEKLVDTEIKRQKEQAEKRVASGQVDSITEASTAHKVSAPVRTPDPVNKEDIVSKFKDLAGI